MYPRAFTPSTHFQKNPDSDFSGILVSVIYDSRYQAPISIPVYSFFLGVGKCDRHETAMSGDLPFGTVCTLMKESAHDHA